MQKRNGQLNIFCNMKKNLANKAFMIIVLHIRPNQVKKITQNRHNCNDPLNWFLFGSENKKFGSKKDSLFHEAIIEKNLVLNSYIGSMYTKPM